MTSLCWSPIAGHAAEPPSSRDPQIETIVKEISAQRIEATIRHLVQFRTRHTLSVTTNLTEGIGAARDWIRAELEQYGKDSAGRLMVEFDRYLQSPSPPRTFQEVELVNVVATLPGLSPESKDRVFVVSGHYDSRALNPIDTESEAPGADDDASGTAAVMELARVMSKHTFNATIVFLAVAGEEQGLFGARHWAEGARARHLNVAGMFTNDIIGTDFPGSEHSQPTVRLFAEGVPPLKSLPEDVLEQLRTGGENDFPTRQLARAVKSAADLYVSGIHVRVIYRRDRFLRGGDHFPFLDAGFSALRFTEPVENYAHQHQNVRRENNIQYGDLLAYIDFNYVAKVAQINAAALASLALAPASPSNVEVETAQLENDTSLRWEENSESDLSGYRIVWRETTAAFWEHSLDVVKVTRFTVKGLSKDNLIFGLQAVDKDGHASPAVYPRPFRTPSDR